jgi:hypothetical protein
MARLNVSAQNKNGQTISEDKFLAIYKDANGTLFTGNKGYDSLVAAIRKNDTAVGAINVGEWLALARSGGIDSIDAALGDGDYVA